MTAKKPSVVKSSDISFVHDGITYSGPADRIIEQASKLGVDLSATGKFYYSESTHQFVSISTMHADHLKNALFKSYRLLIESWLDSLRDCKTYTELVVKFFAGPKMTGNDTVVILAAELQDRISRKEIE